MAPHPSTTTPRVLFITTGLDTGGAEKMLARLIARLHGDAIEAEVISLLGRGAVSGEIEALGVRVWHLGLTGSVRLPMAMARLAMLARRFRPDVIQGWMYHGNLAALIARAACMGRPLLMWGIRQSLYDLSREKPGTRWVIRLSRHFSTHADAIVYNSETACRQHEAFGFSAAHALVIDNGFDTEQFRPDPSAHHQLCDELGIGRDARLVGLVARHHPMKGHKVFLDAAAILANRLPNVHFVLVGRGILPGTPSLQPWLSVPALAGRVHMLGERHDVHRLTAAFNIAVSASWGEAFPNAVGEAMSCAVPCVATDVGDTTRIVGDTGIIVPPGVPSALAEAWQGILCLPEPEYRSMGSAARQRVTDNFSLDRIAARYETLFRCAPLI